jgi:hypothetical protein
VSARIGVIEQLHALPYRGVFAVTGGGALLLSDLLTVPGASATVLEARVPYAERALAEFLGAAPDQACSAATACDIAMAAFQRARTLAPDDAPHRFGFGCTASLATKARKRGEHRAHIALQTLHETRTWSIAFTKGARDRQAEERLLADIALAALADALGFGEHLDLGLLPGEAIDGDRASAPDAWGDILLGHIRATPVHPCEKPTVLFPGAFNPLHDGHLAMAHHAQRVYGKPVAFEICANNVDKPQLNYLALRHRVSQFDAQTPVWITNTATFVEKARCFPGISFVVGVDTVVRIGMARYYGGDPTRLASAVGEIGDLDCRFLVFGRTIDGRFTGLDDVELPPELRALCTAVPEADFRQDVSSTALRSQAHDVVPRQP